MKLISKANYLLHFYAISNSRTALLTRQPRANTVLLQALHSWTHLFSVHRTCVSLCRALTLTKNLRGGLVFLDDHMSSPRRNIKHLKVTLSSSSSGGRSGGVRKEKTETVTLADTQTLGLQRWTSQITTSSDRFALRRCLESEYRKGKQTNASFPPHRGSLRETYWKQPLIHIRVQSWHSSFRTGENTSPNDLVAHIYGAPAIIWRKGSCFQKERTNSILNGSKVSVCNGCPPLTNPLELTKHISSVFRLI